MGGKNNFQGIAYVVAAGVCTVLGISFLVARLVKPRFVFHPILLLCLPERIRLTNPSRHHTRPLGDDKYLSWNKPQASQPSPPPQPSRASVASGLDR